MRNQIADEYDVTTIHHDEQGIVVDEHELTS